MANTSDDPASGDGASPLTGRDWFLAGVRAALSLPGLLLMIAMLGFSALAKEAGLSLAETLFITLVVWALPAQPGSPSICCPAEMSLPALSLRRCC